MKKLILFLIIISSPLAYSDSIHYGVFTGHFKYNDTYNNINQMVAIETNDFIFSSFINSYHHQTYLFGKIARLTDNFGVLYGVSHGYDSGCFALSTDECSPETYKKEWLPAAALKITVPIQKTEVSAIVANYVSLAIGFRF